MDDHENVCELRDAIAGLHLTAMMDGQVLSDWELAECIYVQVVANRLQAEREAAASSR
jgi:hypothetical protein